MRYDPSVLVIIFVVVIVVFGSWYAANNYALFKESTIADVHPQSSGAEVAEQQDTSPSPISDPSTLHLEQSATGSGQLLTELTYPDALVKHQTEDHLELESSAQPVPVTDWYKNKIRELGFKTTTVQSAQANTVVDNKLVAVKDNQEISVEVKKASASAVVQIIINTKY